MKTVELATARKLKEAGWKETESMYNIPAPTLDELLEEMPAELGKDGQYRLECRKYLTHYEFDYRCVETGVSMLDGLIMNLNPAEAVALLWLKLKSEGLIK